VARPRTGRGRATTRSATGVCSAAAGVERRGAIRTREERRQVVLGRRDLEADVDAEVDPEVRCST
jgi:hypothetical protein